MSANFEVRGDVAVITMDNPPVNGLGYDTRRGIVEGLDRALADPKVKAIVLTGAGKAFSGGADIREFGSPKAIAEPEPALGDRRARGEPEADRRRGPQRRDGRRPRARARLPLPRRAQPGAQIALPEVKIGLHPRRRRHAAPAARARRRDRAQHDRQRRAGQERGARQAAGTEALRQDRRRRRRRRRGRVRAREGRRAAAADRRASSRSSTRTPTRTSSSRATRSARCRRTSRRRSSASTPSPHRRR